MSATPQGSPNTGLDVKVNFQDQSTTPPAGYLADWGQAYGSRSDPGQGSGLSYGWVVPGTSTPLSLVGNGRNRNNPPYSVNDPDLRLATFVHMQGNDIAGFNGVATPGAWEVGVPNGTYTVTVAVGDDAATDSVHQIQIEGQATIPAFMPTASNRHATASRVVTIADGRVTVDATGGRNTKIDYVRVVAGSTPSPFTTITWSTVAQSPISRAEAEGAVVDGKLYVFGGWVDNTYVPTARMDVYDPTTNSWTQLASMPVGLTHIGVAVSGHDIYIAGGYPPGPGGTGQTWATTSVSKYNVDTNAWTAMPSLPRRAAAARSPSRTATSITSVARTSTEPMRRLIGFSRSREERAGWRAPRCPSPGTISVESRSTARSTPSEARRDKTPPPSTRPSSTSGTRRPVRGNRSHLYRPLVPTSALRPSRWATVSSRSAARRPMASATSQSIAYDPADNSWTPLTPLPVAVHSGVADNLAGVIYYTTGFRTTTYKGVPGN